jgi:glycerol uptake facilitator-like aquaporin
MKTFRPCLAELLGTFFLCFAGIGAILSNTPAVGGASGLLGIALAHGLALSIAVNAFGGESGAHFNPAVTAGFLLTRRIAPRMAIAYVIAQLLGATTAAGFCRPSSRPRRFRPPISGFRCRRPGRQPGPCSSRNSS